VLQPSNGLVFCFSYAGPGPVLCLPVRYADIVRSRFSMENVSRREGEDGLRVSCGYKADGAGKCSVMDRKEERGRDDRFYLYTHLLSICILPNSRRCHAALA